MPSDAMNRYGDRHPKEDPIMPASTWDREGRVCASDK
jgi:hypothetical protein